MGYVELEIRGDVAAAIKEYRKVIELRPDSPEAHSNLAVAQKKQGELDAAVVSLNKALELKPDSVGALTTRGRIFAELGKWTEARRDFEQALKINPRDDGALYGLSQALREAKEYAGAQSALERFDFPFAQFRLLARVGPHCDDPLLVGAFADGNRMGVKGSLRGKFMKARTEANG